MTEHLTVRGLRTRVYPPTVQRELSSRSQDPGRGIRGHQHQLIRVRGASGRRASKRGGRVNNDRAPGRRNAAQGIDSRGARGPIARTYRSRTLRLPHTVTTPAIGATGHPAFACCVTKRTPWRLTTGPMTSTRRWHSRPYKVALTAESRQAHLHTEHASIKSRWVHSQHRSAHDSEVRCPV